MWTASGNALNGRGKPCPRLILQGLEETAAYQDEAGKRYTGFMLQTLGLPLPGDYGQVLRAKGIVAGTDGKWLHFDYVPGEVEIRNGAAGVTGRLCVIGAKLKEDALTSLFHLN